MQQQAQTLTEFLSLRNYFNKRYLCEIVKRQQLQLHQKFTPQMCPKSAQSEEAELKKLAKIPTSTAKTKTSMRSYRHLQRRSSNNNSSTGASTNINCTSGAIRTDYSHGNAKSNNKRHSYYGYNLCVRNGKSFTARRRITITSGQLLLTMLLSSVLVLEANSTVASSTYAIISLTKTTNTATPNAMLFLNTSTSNVPTARTAESSAPTQTKSVTIAAMGVTPPTNLAAPPVLSLVSASAITNVPDATPVTDAMLSTPPIRSPSASPLRPISNPLSSSSVTTIMPASDPPVELFAMEKVTTIATTTDDNVESATISLQPPPPSDVLIKGFSIPTFLPPFPSFAMADLPAYKLAPTSLAAVTPTVSTDPQDQLYLAAYQQNALRLNLSMPTMNITVQMGNHAYLPCNIHHMLNKPISWVRLRDGHILSVDQATFIADQRFQAIFQGEDEYTWSLQIKYVQDTDEGWYECQVSTEPKMSAKIYLGVVVPHTELIGDQNRFVKAGSKVALHCIVRDTLDPPTYIIWFRGKTQIANDNKMGWYTEIDRTIFGNADSNRNTIGSLIIPFVKKKDSGNYTCQPSNSAPVSVDLHVLSGEYSASAIMSAGSTYRVSGSSLCCLLLLLVMLVVPKT
ncbi:uncharacterized protein LOC129235410 [Anastrepha obliqua]|uniref:uncharacterized protein LOC129235410 n=1 Tax=Anastrepha obliqua TaxID=95512 RepID=UPI002409038D|nr:uncharacterized protein LOC129235410 [Anastrepha obliqua]XP_054725209.1 uncharacterized protein LOC129235410 [Anastrepha obliqua]XP_054725210.1 uncharacterized protein LOC129235410 [Anastrepha obliqua]XP_054725211.1 uncharacterized protein LOC129235410 [Anastrepha obliqua]XP_054725212.1 uncharacterized protein LOC129235410 [Anastrepha obliqua]